MEIWQFPERLALHCIFFFSHKHGCLPVTLKKLATQKCPSLTAYTDQHHPLSQSLSSTSLFKLIADDYEGE